MSVYRSKKSIATFVGCVSMVATTFITSATRAEDENSAPRTADLGQGYTREGEFILFEGKRIDQEGKEDIGRFSKAVGRQLTLCHEVDATSFQVLSEEYTKDTNKVYYKWISPGRFWVVELAEADVASFEVLGFNLARDKKQVWWYGEVQPEVDAATVTLVADGFVWKDSQNVWYQRQEIIGADPKTFQHLGSAYYGDAERIYWGHDPIDGADLATFKVLGDSFIAVDRNMVYRSGRRLPNIDPGSCRFILHDPCGYQVISDKNGVYLNQLKFLHADPKTFKMVDNLTGQGGKYVFLVDTYHSTPVTVYREEDRLITETLLYETGTTNPLAIVKADVFGDKLENITFSPAPGKAAASPVPDWQVRVFQRPDLVKRMKAAGERLVEAGGDYEKLHRLRIRYFEETIAIKESVVDVATAEKAAEKWRALLPLESEINKLEEELGRPYAERQAEQNKRYEARHNPVGQLLHERILARRRILVATPIRTDIAGYH